MTEINIIISHALIDVAAELVTLDAEACDIGASASFVGYCRGASATGAVRALSLQHYPGFTENVIRGFAEDMAAKHAPQKIIIRHRVGEILPGEAIVLVAATATHRAAAFKVVETLMDYLKSEAPFWKQEHRADGAHWIEPTDEDYARLQQRRS